MQMTNAEHVADFMDQEMGQILVRHARAQRDPPAQAAGARNADRIVVRMACIHQVRRPADADPLRATRCDIRRSTAVVQFDCTALRPRRHGPPN